MAESVFHIGDVNKDIDSLNDNIMIAPDWSNPTNNICTTHNVGWTATGNGFILVSKEVDRGMQININNVVIFYVAPAYYGTSKLHIEWLIPVKKGDIIKLLSDNSTLPSGMSATFFPGRTA